MKAIEEIVKGPETYDIKPFKKTILTMPCFLCKGTISRHYPSSGKFMSFVFAY